MNMEERNIDNKFTFLFFSSVERNIRDFQIMRGRHHKLIVRGGHRKSIQFAQIHYINFYTLPYQPRAVSASSDEFSGKGCMCCKRCEFKNTLLNLDKA